MNINTDTGIAELAARLEHYNAAYRSGAPEISDLEYDLLVETLRGLEPEHPLLALSLDLLSVPFKSSITKWSCLIL